MQGPTSSRVELDPAVQGQNTLARPGAGPNTEPVAARRSRLHLHVGELDTGSAQRRPAAVQADIPRYVGGIEATSHGQVGLERASPVSHLRIQHGQEGHIRDRRAHLALDTRVRLAPVPQCQVETQITTLEPPQRQVYGQIPGVQPTSQGHVPDCCC